MLLTVLLRYCKVSWGAYSLISRLTCFRFWSKTFAKRCTNNSLLSHDKTISSLLELIGYVFLISECFRKTLIALDFDEKLTQCVAQITIKCQKTFFSCTLRLVRCFQFQGMIWKTEACRIKQKYCIKNIAVKIPILILFRICLICWRKNHLFASCICCSCKLF